MKNHIIISLLILLIGCSQKEYNSNDTIKLDNGLWTEKFSDEPISGKVYDYFGEKSNPKKVYLGNHLLLLYIPLRHLLSSLLQLRR